MRKLKFETCLLAKEKGFNEQTFSNCWVKTLDGDIIHNSESGDQRCEQYVMQPSFMQLQDYIRKRGIDICVFPSHHPEGKIYGFKLYNIKKGAIKEIKLDFRENHWNEDYKDTFELALNISLNLLN